MDWSGAITAAWAANFVALLNASAAVAVGFYTAKITTLNKILAEEAKKTRETRERADIICAIEPHQKGSSMLELVICNQGTGAALDVIVRCSAENVRREGGFFGPSELHLASLLAGRSIRAFVGTGFDLGKEAVIHTQVFYADAFGMHEHQMRQEIGGLFGLVRVPQSAEWEMAEGIKRISQDLKDITSGFKKLNVAIYGAKDREAERLQNEEFMEEAMQSLASKTSGTDPVL